MAETTPVTLVAGIHRDDRCAWLKERLQEPAFARAVVLATPASAAAIRHGQVRILNDRPPVFSAGCPCCAVSSDLARALGELLPPARRGDVSHVLVETTDPLPALTTLLTDRVASAAFQHAGIVTVVGADGPDDAASIRLVALADNLVVTTDSPVMHGRLGALNPFARFGNQPSLPPAWFHMTESGLSCFGGLLQHGCDGSALGVIIERLGTSLLRLRGVLHGPDGQPQMIEAIRHKLLPPRRLAEAVAPLPHMRLVTQGLDAGGAACILAMLGITRDQTT